MKEKLKNGQSFFIPHFPFHGSSLYPAESVRFNRPTIFYKSARNNQFMSQPNHNNLSLSLNFKGSAQS